MYIPDLFGAYVKGRELAIEKNWQDLRNFESIENARNQNDMGAMDVWERRQQMPGKMSMFNNNVEISDLNTQVARAAQRGLLARANMGSDVAVGDYGIYKAYEPEYLQVKGDKFGAMIGQQANAVQNLLGQNEYLAPIARELGKIYASTGANQIRANGVLGDNLVNAANQDVTLSNQAFGNAYTGGKLLGMQLDSQITQQPFIHANTLYELKNVISDDKARREERENPPQVGQAEISALWGAFVQDDPEATHRLEALGQLPAGTFMKKFGGSLGVTQNSGSAQTTPTTGQTQNSVPVGTNTVLAPTGTPQTNQSVQDTRSLLPSMFQNSNGGQVYNHPVSPEYGQYRPIMPTPTPQEVQQQQLINRLSGRQGGIL